MRQLLLILASLVPAGMQSGDVVATEARAVIRTQGLPALAQRLEGGRWLPGRPARVVGTADGLRIEVVDGADGWTLTATPLPVPLPFDLRLTEDGALWTCDDSGRVLRALHGPAGASLRAALDAGLRIEDGRWQAPVENDGAALRLLERVVAAQAALRSPPSLARVWRSLDDAQKMRLMVAAAVRGEAPIRPRADDGRAVRRLGFALDAATDPLALLGEGALSPAAERALVLGLIRTRPVAVARAVVEHGRPATALALVEALDGARPSGITALWHVVQSAPAALSPARRAACRAVLAGGADAVRVLFPAVAHADVETGLAAVAALRALGGERAVGTLAQATSPHGAVRAAIHGALVALAPETRRGLGGGLALAGGGGGTSLVG